MCGSMEDRLIAVAGAAGQRRDALRVFEAWERNEDTGANAATALTDAASALRRQAGALTRDADELVAFRARILATEAIA